MSTSSIPVDGGVEYALIGSVHGAYLDRGNFEQCYRMNTLVNSLYHHDSLPSDR